MQSRQSLIEVASNICSQQTVSQVVLYYNAIKNDSTFSSEQKDYLLKLSKQRVLELHLQSTVRDKGALNQSDSVELLNTHRGKFAKLYGRFFTTTSDKIRQLIESNDRVRADALWRNENRLLEEHSAVRLKG